MSSSSSSLGMAALGQVTGATGAVAGPGAGACANAGAGAGSGAGEDLRSASTSSLSWFSCIWTLLQCCSCLDASRSKILRTAARSDPSSGYPPDAWSSPWPSSSSICSRTPRDSVCSIRRQIRPRPRCPPSPRLPPRLSSSSEASKKKDPTTATKCEGPAWSPPVSGIRASFSYWPHSKPAPPSASNTK